MKRPSNSRPKRRRSPYPARGTPAGDIVVGTCAHCGEELYRGDMFFTPLTGKLLCLAGWQAPVEVCVPHTEPEPMIWDGDFPE